MIKNISLLLFLLSVSLFSKHAHAQHARPDPEPFSYSSSAATQKEAKEITGLRASYRQFMLAVSASKSYNFNQIRSASAITVGSTEEESLQYLIEASRIIR
jgi:hypothetical protein